MNTELDPTPPTNTGLTVEHILISVAVVHTNQIMQYDDSCAHLIGKGLKEFNGVQSVQADVLYKHTKIEVHLEKCECGYCTYRQRMEDLRVDPFTGYPLDA